MADVTRQVETSEEIVSPEVSNNDTIESILVRSGVPAKRYRVPVGTTVGDLIRNVGATIAGQDLFVGANQIGEDYILRPSDLVRVVPRPQNA